MNPNKPINAQAQLDLSQTLPITCDECGKENFVIKFKLRRLSALVSPSGEEMIIPMQVFACSNCGHINEEFLPE
jgi:hypothetical protein